MENEPLLEINNLSAGYGQIQVLWDVCLKVYPGEIVALVGANGAGKTTLLHTISGNHPLISGEVKFRGQSITGVPANQIVELGLSHIPEGRQLFTEMSIEENLDMGAYAKRAWKRKAETLQEVYELFPRLKERAKQLARTLSGGEQQMLAIARGLMSLPELCIIDEPSNGLAPKIVAEVFKIIQTLRERGKTILIVEQNVKQTLEIADRACVLENGRMELEGCCEDLLKSDHIRKAYLGM